ncbi:histidine phosphatase family protein [Mesobacillus zeae]|uniref:Histidine phosphatase family protein n=1 Tax=Mesobacillus zeae TaxID=1917180 RepID=A0A398B719_9BACI|nr:histidine phosphatase family protein [Mesobacillus zeae]RID85745.1 histidine phosphatase family protein [Mesobacillus zeae]
MLQLYVIRHGETEWNVEKRSQGRLDSALTEKGRRDAHSLGERLKETEFEWIYCSPSGRTMETASIVAGNRSIPLVTDERLMEIDLKDWQGKTEDEVKKEYPKSFQQYWNEPELYDGGSGESFADVRNRLASFLQELEESSLSGNVLVITHGIVIKTLYLLCREQETERIWDPPFIHGTCLTIVKMDENGKELLLKGCMAHSKA